jgi:hypothetical protein
MRVLSLIALVAAKSAKKEAPVAESKECEPLLSMTSVYALGEQTYALYTDMATTVGKGLYREGTALMGPEKTKLMNTYVDQVLLQSKDYYSKGMETAGPFVEQAQTAMGAAYVAAKEQIEPRLDSLNTYLQGAIQQFAKSYPAHATILTATSLMDKVLLIMWLVFSLTLSMRLLGLALSIVRFFVFLPCRLLCGRRAKTAPVSGKKFSGKSQSNGNANGAKSPAPPKKK